MNANEVKTKLKTIKDLIRVDSRPLADQLIRPRKKDAIVDRFQLLVTCRDENDQRRLYERLIREGYRIRVLVL